MQLIILQIVSYSMVVLYIEVIKVWGSLYENPTSKPAKYLLSDSMEALVNWLGIAKPKNVFRSTLNLSTKLL